MPNAWDKQPGETVKAFHAFVHYRELSAAERSIDTANAVCAKEHGISPKATRRTWGGWSSKNNWPSRAGENDSSLAERRRLNRAAQLERAQDTIATVAHQALLRVLERLTTTEAADIPVGMLPQWLRTAADIELKALGHEDKVQLTGKDGGPVEVASTVHLPDAELWAEIIKIREGLQKEEEPERYSRK